MPQILLRARRRPDPRKSILSEQSQQQCRIAPVVLVKLLGPSAQTVTVPDGQAFGARVAVGDYYGKNDTEDLFQKAGPVKVIEDNGHHFVGRVTLQHPAADDPKAREEFYKGQ